jgi:hypothetical protein
VDATGAKFMEAWIYNDGKEKWIGMDFGVMNENSDGLGTNAPILPGRDAQGVTTIYTGIDEEFNPTNGGEVDCGLRTHYFDWLFQPSPYNAAVPGTVPDYNEGRGNGVFDTKDLNGNGNLNSSEAYFSYVFKANWGTGWRLVKIPINLAAADGVSTTPDGIQYIFHNQGINPLTPIVSTVRFWMTGASAAEINGFVLLESLRLTKNRWEAAVDSEAAELGASPDPSKFDVSSISQDRDASYTYNKRFIMVQTGQNEDTLYKTEKALVLTYNLSDNDYVPPGDPSGRPVYFATRRYSQPLDFTDFVDLKLDVNVRAGTSLPGEVLFVRLENDYQNYYQYNIPLTPAQGNTWDQPVGARLDGSDHHRVKRGRPFLNRVNQITIGVLSPNPGVNQVRVIWINNLRGSGAAKREGLARRFNTSTTLGKNFATVSTRYREVEGGFSQLDQTGTRFQLARQTGVDFTSNSIKVLKETVSIQASLGNDDRLTEDRLRDNPFYYDLPETRRRTETGSLSYSKTLPKGAGRLTSLRLSGSDTLEKNRYQSGYLQQSNVQGNSERGASTWSLGTIYDMPKKVWKIPLGVNQWTQNYSFTNDTQRFENPSYFDFERHTRVQSYNWTNTTELFKRLVFNPGYNWSFTEAKGNTTFAGQAGRVEEYVPFEKRISPKMGVGFRGLRGLTPSVDYTGSVRNDYGSTSGMRFNNTNNLNYTVAFNPGAWVGLAR